MKGLEDENQMRENNILNTVKKSDGFTLLEVMIAFVILVASFFIIENAFLDQRKIVFQVEDSINRSLAFSEIFQGLQANILKYNKHNSPVMCPKPGGGNKVIPLNKLRDFFDNRLEPGDNSQKILEILYNCFHRAFSVKGLTSVTRCPACSERAGMMMEPYLLGGVKPIKGTYRVRVLTIKKIESAGGTDTYKRGNYYSLVLGD